MSGADPELDIPIDGQLTATLVADEESGGTWGAQWLLENVPMTRGDASLNSEPTDMDQVLIGHKGKYWLNVETRHGGGMATLPVEDDAIALAMQVAEAVKKKPQGWKLETPSDVIDAIALGKVPCRNSGAHPGEVLGGGLHDRECRRHSGRGAEQYHPTHCHMEVDARRWA